jgi:hypothetical protein
MRIFILILLAFTLFAADPPADTKLPPDAQKAMDACQKAEDDARKICDATIAKAEDTARKALEKAMVAATKRGDLDAANAIKAKLAELQPAGASDAAPKVDITIQKAEYGVEGAYVDCTQFIKDRTNNGQNEWPLIDSAMIQAVGDPAGGLKKGVRVTYFLNGEKKVTIFPYTSVIKLQGTTGP